MLWNIYLKYYAHSLIFLTITERSGNLEYKCNHTEQEVGEPMLTSNTPVMMRLYAVQTAAQINRNNIGLVQIWPPYDRQKLRMCYTFHASVICSCRENCGRGLKMSFKLNHPYNNDKQYMYLYPYTHLYHVCTFMYLAILTHCNVIRVMCKNNTTCLFTTTIYSKLIQHPIHVLYEWSHH
jgi:hypothetical protein